MSSKAENGAGSVYRRAGDGRWVAAFVDPITGKRRVKYGATEAEARRALRAMTSRSDAGEVVLDVRMTLSVYAEAWLRDRGGRRRAPATVGEYRWRLEHYVLPLLGRKRVGDLTVVDVEDMLDALAAQGRSAATLRAVRNALAALLSDAIRARLLRTGNVARMAQLPDAPGTAKVVPPSAESVRRLLDATAGTELGRLLRLLAGTGARIGEALGARWSDLDLEAGTWTVARTVSRDADRRVVLGDRTKSGAARTVALGPTLVETLREQRRAVAEARLGAAYWEDLDLVFPTSVGTMRDPRNVRKDLRPVAAAAGFAGSFHALRHFVASVALAETANETLTAKVLGHARRATTTDVYGHLLDEDALGVSAALERRLGGVATRVATS